MTSYTRIAGLVRYRWGIAAPKPCNWPHVRSTVRHRYAEADGCCFPFTYIMVRDLVHDVADMAASLQLKWYGTISQSDDATKKSRGGRGVRRLLENCRKFSVNRLALSQYETLLQGKIGLFVCFIA